MMKFKYAQQVLKKYRKDEGGQIAMLFGLVFMTLMLAVGVGYDYSQLTHAYAKSQSVADQTALQAAIYVKNNGVPPSSSADGMVHNQVYTAGELGHHYNAFVRDGATGVNVKVEYDAVKKEATAYVTGKTVPAFLQVFNYGDLDFNAKSVANYEQLAPQDEASVVLILDNSGSMAFDDKKASVDYNQYGWADKWDDFTPASNATKRIDGLESSVEDFLDHLDNVIGPQTKEGERVLRTGMLAYNGDLIAARTSSPNWGTNDVRREIGNMVPGGSTNSSPPMALAASWLAAEPAAHLAETGEDTPLKFAIFMTDGQNTSGNKKWEKEDDTGLWRAWSWWQQKWFYVEADHKSPPWQEGKLVLQTDNETLAHCETMKADGVVIYTISFALQPGWYYTNEWGNGYNNPNPDYWETDNETYQGATALMSGCASEEALFIQAHDTQALQAAFQRIANHIVTELIRLKS